MENKILLILVALMIGNITLMKAQSESQRKNIIKINILPPILGSTGEISYERIVNPKVGVVLGLGTNLRADKSEFDLQSDSNLDFTDRDVQSLYILGEVRCYVDFCNDNCNAPHGFYAGLFFRYNQIDLTANPRFDDGNTSLDFDVDIGLRSFNFGPLFGYQINYKNFIVDFEFGGLGYAPNWISFDSSSELSNDALANLSENLSDNFGIGNGASAVTLNESSTDISFWTWTFRYAVSVGYNF